MSVFTLVNPKLLFKPYHDPSKPVVQTKNFCLFKLLNNGERQIKIHSYEKNVKLTQSPKQ